MAGFTEAELAALNTLRTRTARQFKVAHCLLRLDGSYLCLDFNRSFADARSMVADIEQAVNAMQAGDVLPAAGIELWEKFGDGNAPLVERRNTGSRWRVIMVLIKKELP